MTGALTVSGQVVGLVLNNTGGDCFSRYIGTRSWTVGPEASAGTFWIYDTSASAIRIAITSTGACSNATGTWTAISDASLKEDITPYQRGLDEIRALDPVFFRYRAQTPFGYEDGPSEPHIGLLADDVRPYLPELVGEATVTVAGKPQLVDTLDTGNLVYALINAVKTLATKVESLEARLA